MRRLTRRQALELGASALALFGGQHGGNRRGVLQGGFHGTPRDGLRAPAAAGARAFRIDFDRGTRVEVDTHVPIHVLEPHPLDPHLSVATSKRADIASLIDWKRQKEAAVLRLPPGHRFYGHSAFSADGAAALLTAYEARSDGSYRYRLLVVDIESFEVRADVTCPIGATHDVVHLGGSMFAVGGAGHADYAPIVLFDLSSSSFRRWPGLPEHSTASVASHLLAVSESHVLAVMSRTTAGSVDDGSLVELDTQSGRSRQLVPIGHPDFATELLSFVLTGGSSRVWFSVPERRRVVVWNIDTQRVENSIEFEQPPRSLSVLGDRELVAIGTDKGFSVFDARSSTPLRRLDALLPSTGGAGVFGAHTRLSFA